MGYGLLWGVGCGLCELGIRNGGLIGFWFGCDCCIDGGVFLLLCLVVGVF